MGARILRRRKEKGLTQEALANKLGVSNQAVSKWEGDVCCPDLQLLPLLADTLGAGRDDSALEDLVLELHAKLQAQPYEDKWLEAQRAFWRAVPDKIEDTPYGKILLNEVRRKARHCKNLLQRAAQEMCANDALNQKYAPAFLDASYQLEALEGKTAEGWDAARGVTVPTNRRIPAAGNLRSSSRNSSGRRAAPRRGEGQRRRRDESAHEKPVGQLQGDRQGLCRDFFRLVRRGGGGPAHDGARNARTHRPDGGLFPPVQRGKTAAEFC